MNDEIDIRAEDREGRPVLIVKVRYDEALAEDFWEILGQLDAAVESVRFGMLVDPETIRIFRRDLEHPKSVSELDTAEVLAHYSTRYADSKQRRGFRPIFRIYLTGLMTSLAHRRGGTLEGGGAIEPGRIASDRALAMPRRWDRGQRGIAA